MFYDVDIWNSRGGKFGAIWLFAVRNWKLTVVELAQRIYELSSMSIFHKHGEYNFLTIIFTMNPFELVIVLQCGY